MATIRDVAKMAGVSISTVSLALNNSEKVSNATNRKVWAAAKSVGYSPNPIAQSLARGHTDLIGMIVGDVANPFFGQLLKEVEHRFLDQGHLVVVSDTEADPERELAMLDHLAAQRAAGALLSPHGSKPDYVARIRKAPMPLVLIDHKVEGVDADFVSSDNILASAMITEHVIRLGHHRIAHISGSDGLWTSDQRKLGFRQTMNAAGVAIDESLIVQGHYGGDRAYECTMRLLTMQDRPTAILAANNVMALGALQAMNDLGVRCPEDVSLASIDDVPWGNVIQPRITMVFQPISEIATIATKFLLERINERGGPKAPAREVILIPKLSVGTSCAPPPKSGTVAPSPC